MTDVEPDISDLPYCLGELARGLYNQSAIFEFERSFTRGELQTYLPSQWSGSAFIEGRLKLPAAPMFASTVVAAVVDDRLAVGFMGVNTDSAGALKASVRGGMPTTPETGEMDDRFSVYCDLEPSGRGEGATFQAGTESAHTHHWNASPVDSATGLALALFMHLSDTLRARPDRVRHARGPEPRPIDDERARPASGPDTPAIQWRPGS